MQTCTFPVVKEKQTPLHKPRVPSRGTWKSSTKWDTHFSLSVTVTWGVWHWEWREREAPHHYESDQSVWVDTLQSPQPEQEETNWVFTHAKSNNIKIKHWFQASVSDGVDSLCRSRLGSRVTWRDWSRPAQSRTDAIIYTTITQKTENFLLVFLLRT